MKELFFSHRLKWCKTFLEKWIDLKNFNESIREGRLNVDSNTKVLILTEEEATTFRKDGYDVEIVSKVSPSYPRRLVDIFVGLNKIRKRMHTLPPTFDVARLLSMEMGEEILASSFHCCACACAFPCGTGNSNGLIKEYLALVREQAKLTEKLAEFEKKLREALPNDGTSISTCKLFRSFVDVNKLADCFHCIFQKFFGPLPTEKLEGDYHEQVDLAAYFFIIVEWEELGSYIFKEKCKKPFFEYINKNVLTEELGVTERTFHNRLTSTMDDFRKKLSTEPVSSKFKGECWKNDFFIKDFLKVLEIFHGTEYYKELELRKHA